MILLIFLCTVAESFSMHPKYVVPDTGCTALPCPTCIFGFNIPKQMIKYQIPAKLLSKYNEWEYDISSADWINISTGEKLCGYELPSYLNAILKNNINTSLQ